MAVNVLPSSDHSFKSHHYSLSAKRCGQNYVNFAKPRGGQDDKPCANTSSQILQSSASIHVGEVDKDMDVVMSVFGTKLDKLTIGCRRLLGGASKVVLVILNCRILHPVA